MAKKKRGFSLIEILVVIGLIALLLGMIVPAGFMLYRAVMSLKNSGLIFGTSSHVATTNPSK